MSQRTFLATGVVNDATGTPVPFAPCSVQILTPTGVPAIDGNGAIVSTKAYPFTTASDGSFSQQTDYPGDYAAAYVNSRVRVILNGYVIDSPIGFAYAGSIAASDWIGSPSVAGLVRMRVLYLSDSNVGIGNTLVSVTLTQTAIPPTGQLAAGQPVTALTDASGAAYFYLWPTSLLNPSTTQYVGTIAGEQQSITFTAPATTDNFLGAYNAGTTYHPAGGTSNGDVVTYGGVTYRFTGATPAAGSTPPSANWTAITGNPTDLITNYYSPPAPSGQIAATAGNISAVENTPSSLHSSPLTVQDVLDDAIYKANHATVGDASTSAIGGVEIDRAVSGHPVVPALISGVVAPGVLPLATVGAFGAVKPDGTTITISGGVISGTGGGGAASFGLVPKSANYTMLPTDSGVGMSAAGGNRTTTLETAVGSTARHAIGRTDSTYANTNTVLTTGGQTIGGSANFPLQVAGQVVEVESDGANWLIVGGITPNPLTTAGDMVYATAGGVLARLPIGTTGQVQTVVAGLPAWATPAASGIYGPLVDTGGLLIRDSHGTPILAAR